MMGSLPSEQLVDDTAQWKPVGSEGILNALSDHLRSHVAMRPAVVQD